MLIHDMLFWRNSFRSAEAITLPQTVRSRSLDYSERVKWSGGKPSQQTRKRFVWPWRAAATNGLKHTLSTAILVWGSISNPRHSFKLDKWLVCEYLLIVYLVQPSTAIPINTRGDGITTSVPILPFAIVSFVLYGVLTLWIIDKESSATLMVNQSVLLLMWDFTIASLLPTKVWDLEGSRPPHSVVVT